MKLCAVYRQAFEEAVERVRSLNGQLVPMDFAPFCEIAQLLYNSAFVAERYAGIRGFIDSVVRCCILSGADMRRRLTSGFDHTKRNTYCFLHLLCMA